MWYYDRVYHYFEAANYLTVAQMFLKDNVLLKESLAKDHIKSIPGGHWGASPGINMIISCILNAIQMSGQDEKDYNLILGSGHANAALLANMYLNGFLEEYYPEYKYGYDGLKALCQAYSSPSGFSGEVSAKMPGCIYPGGELGYALATAYGTVIGNKDRVTFVILGDGECETSTTCAAWLAHKLIDNTEHGHVIPIVNLNQYKMGSRTIMSKMSNSELIQYYAGLGMKAQICEDWHCLADSMIEAVAKIDTDNTVLVYRTVKGWTGPSDPSLSEEDNALNAHKVPIKRPIQNDADFEALKKWLLSYVPSRIFNSTNSPNDEIMQMRYKELFSFITDRETPMQVPSCTKSGNTTSDSLSDILMTSILKGKQIYIFSPDELISNGFGKMLDNGTVQKFVIETLNEGICQAMYEGLTLSNGHGVLISYECFIPIVTSAVSQYAKFLYHSLQSSWTINRPSLVYILTSVCWSNTYTHQNPEFVMDLLMKGYSFIHALYPIDKNTGAVMLSDALQSKNDIRIITYDKRNQADVIPIAEASACVANKYYVWPQNESVLCDCIVLSTGDIQSDQCNKAVQFLQNSAKLSIMHISILDLSLLLENNVRLDQILDEKRNGRGVDIPIIYVYSGYPALIKSLLYNSNYKCNIHVLGYNNKGWNAVPSLMKQCENGISQWDIGIRICAELLKKDSVRYNALHGVSDLLKLQKENYVRSIYGDDRYVQSEI